MIVFALDSVEQQLGLGLVGSSSVGFALGHSRSGSHLAAEWHWVI